MGIGALSTRKTRGGRGSIGGSQRVEVPVAHILMMLLLTGGAFALRYWYNFLSPHINAYGSCDASEYLQNAGALFAVSKLPVSFWHDAIACLTGAAHADVWARVHAELLPLKDFRISGPIFPLFLAGSYLSALTPFDMQTWVPPVFAQCLISALTCLFVGLTASRAFGKPCGYLAALLAAVYPAFIIDSGRLYSETFSACLLSALCYATASNFTRDAETGEFCRSAFISGVLAACLQFTRSAMVLLSVLLVPVIFVQQGWRKGVVALVTYACGFALIALPWLGMQKLAFGDATLVVDRVGHYNLFVGNNTDTGGWLSVPYPDGRGIDEKSLQQLASEAYHRSPSRWWGLFLDKPLRLFAFPWNDFRAPLGDVQFRAQVWWHQAMLLLAFMGAVLGFAGAGMRRSADEWEQSAQSGTVNLLGCRIFLLSVLLLHAVYLFFITVPRYNLTAMPIVLIFSAAGISALLQLTRARNGWASACTLGAAAAFALVVPRLPLVNVVSTLFGADRALLGLYLAKTLAVLALLALMVALWSAAATLVDRQARRHGREIWLARAFLVLGCVLLLPLFAVQANASGRWYEWSAPLGDGQTITQTFTLPRDFAQQVRGRQLYLLVDAEGAAGLANVDVTINGVRLNEPAIPGISLMDDFERFQSTRYGKMREIEWVLNSLTEATTIDNANMRQWFFYPVPSTLVNGKDALKVQLAGRGLPHAKVYGSYSTSASSISIPSVDRCSWEKAFYGVENDAGFSDPRYTAKLRSLAATAYEMDLSSQPGVQSGRYNIHLLAGPPVAYDDHLYTVVAAPPVVAATTILSQPLKVPVLMDSKPSEQITVAPVPAFGKGDLWIVHVRGEVERNAGTARLRLMPRVTEGAVASTDKAYVSPWAGSTTYGTAWTRFDAAVPIQPGDVPLAPDKLTIEFAATNQHVPEAAGLGIQGVSEFRNVTAEIVRLPGNPLHPGYLLF